MRYDYGAGRGFCIDTWYLNHVPHQRRWQLKGEKLTCESDKLKTVDQVRAAMQGKRYLGYNNKGLTAGLKTVLQEMLPDPSKFEGP